MPAPQTFKYHLVQCVKRIEHYQDALVQEERKLRKFIAQEKAIHQIKPHLVENNITLTEKDDEVYNQGHRRA